MQSEASLLAEKLQLENALYEKGGKVCLSFCVTPRSFFSIFMRVCLQVPRLDGIGRGSAPSQERDRESNGRWKQPDLGFGALPSPAFYEEIRCVSCVKIERGHTYKHAHTHTHTRIIHTRTHTPHYTRITHANPFTERQLLTY